jgi:hypothetical protein
MSEGEPGVDRRLYPRETAQAMAGLLAYYDATGVAEARDLAVARHVGARATDPADGGFRHASRTRAGPISPDNVEMAKALLACTARRASAKWLTPRKPRRLHRKKPSSMPRPAVLSPPLRLTQSRSQNRSSSARTTSRRVRMFALLSAYTAKRSTARLPKRDGLPHLAAGSGSFGFLPDVLLAEDELRNEPVHVTIVGAKDDPRVGGALSRGAGLSAGEQARGMVGQARRKACQSRRGLS